MPLDVGKGEMGWPDAYDFQIPEALNEGYNLGS